jgi:adenosylcobinamide-GDP ribazoletransferase
MIASFLAAWMFLTRVPLPRRWSSHEEESVRRSVAWFGVVGLVIGTLAGFPFVIESLPSHYAALLSIAITLLVTGALHEDGFADSCDGIFGGGTPEKRLEIMRDSRVGAFGVLGLVLALGFRFFLLKDLAERDGRELPAILAAVAALSRSTAVALIFADSRRGAEAGSPGESKVSRFFWGPRWVDVLLTGGIAVAAGFLLLGGGGLAVALGVAVLLAGIGFVFFRRMLGRLNGDALGACIVMIELGVLAAILSGFPAQGAEPGRVDFGYVGFGILHPE